MYNRFTTFLTEKLARHLLTGDRILTLKNHMWLVEGKESNAGRHANWHTDGITFKVGIRGLEGRYAVRLSKRKRQELMKRINEGQKYHVSG